MKILGFGQRGSIQGKAKKYVIKALPFVLWVTDRLGAV